MQPTKLYIEITSRCNLNCTICLLNDLEEPTGLMPLATFTALLDQLAELPVLPTLHLAGWGEPTSHPRFIEMVRRAKAAGAAVEMTTNGTLLNADMADTLVKLGMDRVVFSVDDFHTGDDETQLIANIRGLYRSKLRYRGRGGKPTIGLAYVLTKSNLPNLARLPGLAARVGATEVIVSNLVPHTAEMEAEVVYDASIATRHYTTSDVRINMSLPKIDVNAETMLPLVDVFGSRASISLLDASLGARDDYCRFIEDRYAAIRWDGAVSPCLHLLHTHDEYIHGRPRHVNHYALGNINEAPFAAIWSADEYGAFRERVHDFTFSGCVYCAGCGHFSQNVEDCTELASKPVCGGCLWAQGLVQCP